jgi:hypothetical protein
MGVQQRERLVIIKQRSISPWRCSLLDKRPNIGQLMLSVCFLLFNGVFIPEAFHAAGRVHKLLLPRDKWMALGTNFHFNIFLG